MVVDLPGRSVVSDFCLTVVVVGFVVLTFVVNCSRLLVVVVRVVVVGDVLRVVMVLIVFFIVLTSKQYTLADVLLSVSSFYQFAKA